VELPGVFPNVGIPEASSEDTKEKPKEDEGVEEADCAYVAELLESELKSKAKRALMKAKATSSMNEDELTSSAEIATFWCDMHEYVSKETRLHRMGGESAKGYSWVKQLETFVEATEEEISEDEVWVKAKKLEYLHSLITNVREIWGGNSTESQWSKNSLSSSPMVFSTPETKLGEKAKSGLDPGPAKKAVLKPDVNREKEGYRYYGLRRGKLNGKGETDGGMVFTSRAAIQPYVKGVYGAKFKGFDMNWG
jgi:hypothetical protein